MCAPVAVLKFVQVDIGLDRDHGLGPGLELALLGGDEPAQLPDLGEQRLDVERSLAPDLREDLLDLGHGHAGQVFVGLDPLLLDHEAVLELLGGPLVEGAIDLALPARVLVALGVNPAVLPARDGLLGNPDLAGNFAQGLAFEPQLKGLLTFLGADGRHPKPPWISAGGPGDR